MAKKLTKKIEGTDVLITVLGIEEEMVFNTGDLPAEIQSRLIPFGAGHKLGDSAASAKTPEDAAAAIKRVWEGLLAGEWSVRQPAEEKEKAPKISKKTILENLQNLPEDKREMAMELLKGMGIIL